MSEKLNKYYAVVPLSLESLFEEELKQLGITEFKSKRPAVSSQQQRWE